jgi:hypothetical protein
LIDNHSECLAKVGTIKKITNAFKNIAGHRENLNDHRNFPFYRIDSQHTFAVH